MKVLSIQNVHKYFGKKIVLKGISFEIEEGETFVILGKSGQGKSVLLKIIGGLLQPDKGKVIILGKDIQSLTEEELYKLRLNMGMVFQMGALFDFLTIGENVAFPLKVHNLLPEEKIKKEVEKYLDYVGLKGTYNKYPHELSGGMRKRAALARTMIMKPKIVLYDEPTTGLDPVITQEIGSLMKKMTEKFCFTSIVITHDLKLAFFLADTIAILNNGIFEVVDKPENILKSNNGFVQNFLNAGAFIK